MCLECHKNTGYMEKTKQNENSIILAICVLSLIDFRWKPAQTVKLFEHLNCRKNCFPSKNTRTRILVIFHYPATMVRSKIRIIDRIS